MLQYVANIIFLNNFGKGLSTRSMFGITIRNWYIGFLGIVCCILMSCKMTERKEVSAITPVYNDTTAIHQQRPDSAYNYQIHRNPKYFKSTPCAECNAKKGAKGLLIVGGGIVAAFIAMILLIR